MSSELYIKLWSIARECTTCGGIADRSRSGIDKACNDLCACYTIPHIHTMPTKPLEETTGLENHMLFTAAKLLSAVRWVAENPPTLVKMEYLNERVMDEIVCNIITDT